MERKGWSADNITFGMGGALLQKLDRDTQQFAFKSSSIIINGVAHEVFKSPITDPSKISKAGRFKLVMSSKGVLETIKQSAPGEDHLVEVFRDGKILKEYTLKEIRERAEEGMK